MMKYPSTNHYTLLGFEAGELSNPQQADHRQARRQAEGERPWKKQLKKEKNTYLPKWGYVEPMVFFVLKLNVNDLQRFLTHGIFRTILAMVMGFFGQSLVSVQPRTS